MIYQYDARADKCPLPLVKLRVMLKKMADGDSCIIWIADAGSKSDIPKLLDKYQYSYQVITIDSNTVKIQIKGR